MSTKNKNIKTRTTFGLLTDGFPNKQRDFFCYGYGYQWHLLIATPLMVFYWYDDITKEFENNTLNYNLSFKLTMITRALLVQSLSCIDF